MDMLSDEERGLNPCFSGCNLKPEILKSLWLRRGMYVLILVLVDVI